MIGRLGIRVASTVDALLPEPSLCDSGAQSIYGGDDADDLNPNPGGESNSGLLTEVTQWAARYGRFYWDRPPHGIQVTLRMPLSDSN